MEGLSVAILSLSVVQVPKGSILLSQKWGEERTSISAQAGDLSWSLRSGLALFLKSLSRVCFTDTVLLLFAVMSAGLISENLDGSLKGVPVTNGCQ